MRLILKKIRIFRIYDLVIWLELRKSKNQKIKKRERKEETNGRQNYDLRTILQSYTLNKLIKTK